MLAVAFLVCVMAPIAEEFLFRGFMYPALRRSIGICGAALIITGIVFGGDPRRLVADRVPRAVDDPRRGPRASSTSGRSRCTRASCCTALNNCVAFSVAMDWSWQIPILMPTALGIIGGSLCLVRRAAGPPPAGLAGVLKDLTARATSRGSPGTVPGNAPLSRRRRSDGVSASVHRCGPGPGRAARGAARACGRHVRDHAREGRRKGGEHTRRQPLPRPRRRHALRRRREGDGPRLPRCQEAARSSRSRCCLPRRASPATSSSASSPARRAACTVKATKYASANLVQLVAPPRTVDVLPLRAKAGRQGPSGARPAAEAPGAGLRDGPARGASTAAPRARCMAFRKVTGMARIDRRLVGGLPPARSRAGRLPGPLPAPTASTSRPTSRARCWR